MDDAAYRDVLSVTLACYLGRAGHARYGAGRARRSALVIGFSTGTTIPPDYISSIADAAFIDTRIIFAHFRLQLSEGQRFASDLGWLDSIRQPFVEELTAAVFNAPIPIILGGHSLVAGSMWSLVDTLRFADGQVQLPATYSSHVIELGHAWAGRTLREAFLSGGLKGEVIGVQSGGKWYEAPLPGSTVLRPGDKLYIRG